ncbi:unnamed protein product [Adineta ricciae]|uniref:Uncharacterized protein n=1 Tax=Adineta ricciae TaxID=249248 RepID=A0A814GSN3_ADIRI|nr:unnamed protein product [Adineta ricciae]CAF1154450.1 unnamed protein product [Adineta ricciae]
MQQNFFCLDLVTANAFSLCKTYISLKVEQSPGRSFRRLDPLKSESIPAGSLPPDSGRNYTGNILSVPDRFQLEVCRKRSGNDWNLHLSFGPESGGKEMVGKRT